MVRGRRLDQLSATCNEVITAAAVLCQSFSSKLLSELMEGISEDRLTEILDEADRYAAELAYHFAEAKALSAAKKLVRYSTLAGQTKIPDSASSSE